MLVSSVSFVVTTLLLIATAAAQCTVNTPSGTVDLSQIPVATVNISQMFKGSTTPYTWVVGLCQAVSQPPNGATACADGPGFVSEFTTTNCETAWTTPTSAWAYDTTKNAAWAGFVNSKGWPITIYVGCGIGINLRAVGNVDVSYALSFTLTLTSSAMCGVAPNPPNPPLTPVPQPPPPPAPPRPTDQLVQSTCSDPQCASCLNSTTPLGACVPSLTGGSLIAACSASAVILTVFPFSSTCTGASNVTQLPLNQCVAEGGAGGGYVKNTCTAFKSAH